jgi:predicted oxidoreductase (fatty acid repression mutant protein)
MKDAIIARRTYYAISKEQVTTDERIEEIVSDAVKHAPSSFNSQSAGVVILLGKQHDKLWDIVKTELQKIVPPENFQETENKINGAFRSGYGTILYFEDTDVIKCQQQKYPIYADRFPVWAQQSSGMLQYIIWTTLVLDGWGTSLQHYNPIIDDAVKSAWNIPAAWELVAQMPFGKPTAPPEQKDFQALSDRIKIFK